MPSGVSRSNGPMAFQPLEIREEKPSLSVPSLKVLSLRAVPRSTKLENISAPYDLAWRFFIHELSEDTMRWSFLFDQFSPVDLLCLFCILEKKLTGEIRVPPQYEYYCAKWSCFLPFLTDKQSRLIFHLVSIIQWPQSKAKGKLLQDAAILGFDRIVKKYIPYVSQQELEGVLELSCRHESLTVIPLLLEKKVNIYNRTPLHWAALLGDIPKVRRILKTKVNVNQEDSQGFTPLDLAVVLGHGSTIEFLIEHGCELETLKRENNCYVDSRGRLLHLHHLSDERKLSGIRALVNRGFDVNALDSVGQSPMHWAVFHNEGEAIQLLRELGASLEIHNVLTSTPLSIACWSCKCRAIRELLKLGANRNAKDDTGRTPLENFARRWVEYIDRADEYQAVIERFHAQNQRQIVDELCISGKFTIHEAVKHGPAAIRLSLAVGESVSKLDAAGRTPLYYALIGGNFKVARELIRRGALKDTLTELKQTVIPLAITLLLAGLTLRVIWSWKVSLQDSGTNLSSLFFHSVEGR